MCNALALLQCVASHPETRSAFLVAHIPLYLYPFLHTVSKTRPFEYLRLTSLGVIGALVKTDEQVRQQQQQQGGQQQQQSETVMKVKGNQEGQIANGEEALSWK